MAAKKFRKSKFSCPVGGFVGERCLKHRASSMNDAHVRESHAIDRFHAWVDRSRSHGFMRPCSDFHPRIGLWVDVLGFEKQKDDRPRTVLKRAGKNHWFTTQKNYI